MKESDKILTNGTAVEETTALEENLTQEEKDPCLNDNGTLNLEEFQVVDEGLKRYLSVKMGERDHIHTSVNKDLVVNDHRYVDQAIKEEWSRICMLYDKYNNPTCIAILGSVTYSSPQYVLYTAGNLDLNADFLKEYANKLKFETGEKIAKLNYYHKNPFETAKAIFRGEKADLNLLGLKINPYFRD